MNCEQVRAFLPAYLEKGLTPEETAQVQAHLSTCEYCREELKSTGLAVVKLRETLRRRVNEAGPPATAWHSIDKRISRTRVSFIGEWTGIIFQKRALASALLAVLVLAAGLVAGWRMGILDSRSGQGLRSSAVTGAAPQQAGNLPLQIEEPMDDATLNTRTINVRGETEPGAVVSVNDQITVADDQGNFTVDLGLEDGLNVINITASDSAGEESNATIVTNVQGG